jgi:predicted Zn-dependent protease
MLIAWGTTQWLVASMAYAQGAVSGIAGRSEAASPAFERSHALMPWLPLPVQAIAQTKLQLAATETDPARRGRLLGEAETALAEVRRHALPGAADWALAAQVAFAQVRSGDRGKLEASLEAFARATKLSPRNPDTLAHWGWALLYAGDPAGGRRAAEEALAASTERSQNQWVAWAVLALAARQLGDRATEEQASQMARKLAPPAAPRGPNAGMP